MSNMTELKERLESRVKIQILGTVEMVNRTAIAHGHGKNAKTRPTKSVIQLKPISENTWQIWISSAKDLEGQKYDVTNIQRLRTNFVQEGKLTIELAVPPLTVMLRDFKPDELKFFVQKIEYLKKQRIMGGSSNYTVTSDNNNSTKKPSAKIVSNKTQQSIPSTLKSAKTDSRKNILTTTKRSQENESNKTCGSSSTSSSGQKHENSKDDDDDDDIKRRRVSGMKRSHSEMSKDEVKSIKKVLKRTTSLTVKQRSDYPVGGFDKYLETIHFYGFGLRKVDPRISDLVSLQSLSIQNNGIMSIDVLSNLKSRLEMLDMTNNQIDSISEHVFQSSGMSRLKVLILNQNQLKKLPNSICELRYLQVLDVSSNQLAVLPYNMHRMQSLFKLKVNDNHLQFLPHPISILSTRMTHLDVSSNLFKREIKPPRSVRIESEPTLFEIAGSALLTQYCHSKDRGEVPTVNVFDTSQVPHIISEYLNTGKYCDKCGKMCLRYTILYFASVGRLAQTFISCSSVVPIYRVLCNKCHTND